MDFLCLKVWVISLWQEDILVQTKKQRKLLKWLKISTNNLEILEILTN